MQSAAVLIVAATAVALQAQTATDVETLVDRMGRYLAEYEHQLSTVIADERFRQSETRLGPGDIAGNTILRMRALESEVAFLRLPGNAEWFGVRHVRRVDGRTVDDNGPNLLGVMTDSAGDLAARVRAIVEASSRHNLGSARTINMPTVPLEVLHPKNRRRLVFTAGGTTTIGGIRAQELRYRETSEPSIIRDTKGRGLLAQGSTWVGDDGQLLRVTLRLALAHQSVRDSRIGDNELRVDFAVNERLRMLVPRELREDFAIAGGGRVQGRASYSNFRRFTTSARIIPPL